VVSYNKGKPINKEFDLEKKNGGTTKKANMLGSFYLQDIKKEDIT
jgi:hypothetical protein